MQRNTKVVKKICLVGQGGVGKTSLIKRFILDVFDDKYLKTLGTKVSKKVMDLEYPEKDLTISLTLLIWDIMGQETFLHLLQNSYFHGVAGCLAVCDSTKSETLDGLDKWIDGLHQIAGTVPLIFVANKSDLKDSKQIDENLMKNFVSRYDVPYIFTSAKTGDNVEEVFYDLGRLITSDII